MSNTVRIESDKSLSLSLKAPSALMQKVKKDRVRLIDSAIKRAYLRLLVFSANTRLTKPGISSSKMNFACSGVTVF